MDLAKVSSYWEMGQWPNHNTYGIVTPITPRDLDHINCEFELITSLVLPELLHTLFLATNGMMAKSHQSGPCICGRGNTV